MTEGNSSTEANGWLKQRDLFIGGQEGYHTYRIPALVVSAVGTILAFCEGRKYGRGDAGKIDLLLKRSFDSGKTWQDTQLVVSEGDMTCGNPCPVVDRSNGTIWLPFCKNLGDGPESMIVEGKAPRTVWITKSADDGETWAEPQEITQDVKDNSWTWYATGPGHGIQLENGRLVIPCDHIVGVNFNRNDPYHSHIIYSDDHGESWKVGGIVDEGTNESAVVQTADGAVYINCRNYRGGKRRAYAWSYDNGQTFSKLDWDETLVEPMCQGSLARLAQVGRHDQNHVLFSNPASTEREKMTVRVSYDECRTWSVSRLLCEGPSAYSDLAVSPDISICCLYEAGKEHPYEKLTLSQFDIEWLTRGEDHLL